MKNSKLIYYSVIQSLGVFIYTSAVAWFLFNGEHIFGGDKNFLVPVTLLLLFVTSAAITGILVFGRPIYFYLNGLKKEAVKLLIYTIISLFVIISIILVGNIFWW